MNDVNLPGIKHDLVLVLLYAVVVPKKNLTTSPHPIPELKKKTTHILQ